MPKKQEEKKITIDETEYVLDDLSEVARATIDSINFTNAQIQQLQNEWAVADTARIGYTNALKKEASKNSAD